MIGYVVAAVAAASEPAERLCYSCHVSQERISMSVVPTAPQVSFSSLSAHTLPTLGSMNHVDSVNSETTGAMNTMNGDTIIFDMLK